MRGSLRFPNAEDVRWFGAACAAVRRCFVWVPSRDRVGRVCKICLVRSAGAGSRYALVALQSHARGHLSSFAAQVAGVPEVLNEFFLAGAVDFCVRAAATSTANLRGFVVSTSAATPMSRSARRT
jgi:hypothetical protein